MLRSYAVRDALEIGFMALPNAIMFSLCAICRPFIVRLFADILLPMPEGFSQKLVALASGQCPLYQYN